VGFAYSFADTWLLQRFGGAVQQGFYSISLIYLLLGPRYEASWPCLAIMFYILYINHWVKSMQVIFMPRPKPNSIQISALL